MTILDRFRIDDRVAIVTGASSGLGVAFAVALAEAGADVALGARREDRLVAHPQTCRRRRPTRHRGADRRDQSRRLSSARRRHHARLRQGRHFGQQRRHRHLRSGYPGNPEKFRSVIDINLNGCYWMAQACAEGDATGKQHHQHRQRAGFDHCWDTAGCVLRIESRAYRPDARPRPAMDGPQGNPRQCAGSGLLRVRDDGQFADDYIERTVLPRTLEGRLGRAEELSAALIFLASDASSYVTGITLPVEGGHAHHLSSRTMWRGAAALARMINMADKQLFLLL